MRARAGGGAAAPDWDADLVELRERSRRQGWLVAKAGWGVAALLVVGMTLQGRMREVAYVPIVVNQTTGETTVAQRLTERTVPISDALDKHNLARYVGARERYAWRFLQTDYDTVKRMSSERTWAPYNAQFDGPNRIDERLKDTVERRVDIVGVRLAGAVAGLPDTREAVVTYDLTTTAVDRPKPVTVRFQATVQYQYQPKLRLKEADRLDNPLGFFVTAYRTDAEIATVTGAGAQP